ncbi:Sialin [Frankliniella fusca]|uniref:Sialin n=1 Tax=Frankliniella fusca TaxID=407009 RepID=A0AAE1HMB0_9NEOP|nr:Sialin [Frankliniella fusca]
MIVLRTAYCHECELSCRLIPEIALVPPSLSHSWGHAIPHIGHAIGNNVYLVKYAGNNVYLVRYAGNPAYLTRYTRKPPYIYGGDLGALGGRSAPKMTSSQKGCLARTRDALTLNCRQVLNLMVFFGFMFNYMLRVNLTIAIVKMVEAGNLTAESDPSGAVESVTERMVEEDGRVWFQWDEHKQNLILGSFFWGYLMTELPGGRLAETVGARRVLGVSMLLASLLTLVTPVAANLSYLAIVALRALIGFLLGVTWPSMLPMAAQWIPPADRSKFMSNMMASSLGAAVTMPICGQLLATYGWESTFYATGAVGLAWSLLWFALIYDSPAQHPRISDEERRFIEHALGDTVRSKEKETLPVPWRALLTSGPVWAIVLAHVASIYGFFTVVNQLPTFMKKVLNFNIKENGLASSLPYLGKYLMALGTGVIADFLKSRNKISTTAIRKIFTTFAVGVPGLLMAFQIFAGNTAAASVAIFTLALTFNGAVTAGYLGNGLDIAPNFSGTIFGIANMLSSLGGFLSTLMVGSLTYKNDSYGQWQIIFGILSATYFFGAIIYLILGTGELQEWNSPKNKGEKEPESYPLRTSAA